MLRSCRLMLLPLLAACSPTESTRSDTPMASSVPRWATAERYLGPVAADERVAIQVHLQMRDSASAEATLQELSDPQSPRFRQFLSNAEFEAAYAPTADDVATVRAHLEAHGLRVTYVPD